MNINLFKNIGAELKAIMTNNSSTVNVLSFYTKNYGDYYNRIIINKILNKKVHIVDINLYNRLNLDKLVYANKELICGIGSILHFADDNCIVWGTGSIWYESVPKKKPKEILSIRGRLTHKNLLNKGFLAPDIFGDPGLLIQKYSNKSQISSSKKYKLGIIPHTSERHFKLFDEFRKNKDVLVLDIEDIDNFIEDLTSCEHIASSSLHGLIFADSFSIPNVWLSFSNLIHGQHFKYHDYYSSIYSTDISQMMPLKISSANQFKEIMTATSLKEIDLDIDMIEKVLLSYYV